MSLRLLLAHAAANPRRQPTLHRTYLLLVSRRDILFLQPLHYTLLRHIIEGRSTVDICSDVLLLLFDAILAILIFNIFWYHEKGAIINLT